MTTIIAAAPTNSKRLRSATEARGAEGRLDLRGIGGEPRDDLAGLRGVEEAGIEPGEMGEDSGADIGSPPARPAS